MMSPKRKAPDHGLDDLSNAYLPRGSTILGNIEFHNAARIDGRVEGDIVAMAQVTVGESAAVAGRIEAPEVLLAGKVTGDITARRIEIASTATVMGNLSAAVLKVDPGALLDGRCSMSEVGTAHPGIIVLEEEAANGDEHRQQGISFFITKRQRAELKDRGYDDAAIDQMTPAQAHKLLDII